MKKRLKLVLAVIIALCASFAAIGCAEGDKEYYPIRIAKEQFGCERIWWIGGGIYCNNISGYYLEEGGGKFGKDHVFPMEGGYYVVGEDKDGNEIFMLIPFEKHAREGYKAVKYDWPFDYSFKEIAGFAGEHGYKFADGIDGKVDEFYEDNSTRLLIFDTDFHIRYFLKSYFSKFGDVETVYDSLDVKLLLHFQYENGDENFYNCFIIQQDGKLNLIKLNGRNAEDTCVVTYERDAV